MMDHARQDDADVTPDSKNRLLSSLERARQELLDLGLRNNLLNYRLLRSRGVEATATDVDEFYRALVVTQRRIQFVADPQTRRDAPDDAQIVQYLERPTRSSSRVWSLSVDADDAELQRRLLNTHDFARTTMEEQGVNTLFLAIGMLAWYEADSSQQVRHAPLILVPVELTRQDAAARFALTYSGEEIGANLSLREKLKGEFGLNLPSFDPESEGVSGYFDSVERVISSLDRWKVDRERIVLGQFSFNKFLMFHDLDLEAWPEDANPLSHSVLQGLLGRDGFPPQPSGFREDQFLDDVVSDDDLPMVVDADSSQTLALLDALAGRTMIIQGPPGTGKSQTITNLIALSIGQGKKVLFVAEKMAALEVVKRRLDNLGLGVACLELHGTKTRKRRVLDDLNETLGLGEPYLPHDRDSQIQLAANRNWLNEYCRALSTEVGNTGVTTFLAMGGVIRSQAAHPVKEWPAMSLPGVADWSAEEFYQRRSMVTDLQSAREHVGAPVQHPFRGIRRSTLSPVEMENLRGQVRQVLDTLKRLSAANSALWTRLRQQPKESPDAIDTAVATGRQAEHAVAQGEIHYANPAWHERVDAIRELIAAGKAAAEIQQQFGSVTTDALWTADLSDLMINLDRYRHSWFRWLSGEYRQTRESLAAYFTEGAPMSFDDQADIVLNDLSSYHDYKQLILEHDELGKDLFRSHWQGIRSDWGRLDELASNAIELHQAVEKEGLSSSLLNVLDEGEDREVLTSLANDLARISSEATAQMKQLFKDLSFDSREIDPAMSPVERWSVSYQIELIGNWFQHIDSLDLWVAFRAALQKCHKAGLDSVASLAWNWPEAGTSLVDLFEYRRCLELLDHAWRTHQILGTARSDSNEHRRAEFRRLDQEQLRWNQALLARKHWDQLPRDGGGGELRILTTEIQKKRRNLPIRELMKQAGNAVQAVKPVFMMSPLSVANFIPPGSLSFDLIIFDEASQVAPVDAFGAILRGKQAIVVGDDRQLPPTTFFQRVLEGDDRDDAVDDGGADVSDLQSILNLFAAQNAPQRMLRWHYRSQHESLIAVSNSEFYGNRLVVFPSPSSTVGDLGLQLIHISDTVYDRGGSRTNRDEARAVAEAVMEHAIQHPDLTLGVAAFSSAQAEAIRDDLELLRRQRPMDEAFFSEQSAEPFFVKALENVQGDERDVIFISVGYGRDRDGRMTMNFGPVTSDGGERRLNVLITRARRQCVVFSNITDEDISPSSASRGVQALRTFLHYARTGEYPKDMALGGETESPFEDAVRTALVRAGYEIHAQVGSAGYFIDLAVVDPERPGRYLLAIECDGAMYHSARSSRDRDRLRQQVLESLGWTFHRIWSTDWFANPDRELKRAVTAIEHARQRGDAPPEPRTSDRTSHAEIPRAEPIRQISSDDVPELPPYEVASVEFPAEVDGFGSVSDRDLAIAIGEVVQVEGPVALTVLYRRVAHAAGVRRTGSRIQERILNVIRELSDRGYLEIRGRFVWARGVTEPRMRSRAGLDQQERNLDLIAPEELDAIILDGVKRSFTIQRDEVSRLVIRRVGLLRSGQNAVSTVDQRIDQLLQAGRLIEQAGALSIPPANS